MTNTRSILRADSVRSLLVWLAKIGWTRARAGVDGLAVAPRQLRADSRGGVGQYALIILGVVIVGVAVFVAVGGGVLDGGPGDSDANDSEPAADTDPTPVDDGDSNESDDSSDDSDSDEDNSDDGDSDSGDGNESDSDDDPEYAAIAGSVSVTDLGTTDDGVVTLSEYPAGETLARHDLANGSSFRFEELSPERRYTVNVTTQQAPPEEFTVTTNTSGTVTRNLEVGHPMKGTDSFVAEWRVETERGKDYTDGKTVVDGEGNYLLSWNEADDSDRHQQLYLARNENSYRTYGEPTWRKTFDDLSNFETSPRVILDGLSGIDQREFVGEASREKGIGTVYEYRLSDSVRYETYGTGLFVSVDPETGYVTSYEWDTPIVYDNGFVSTVDRGHVVKRNDPQINAIPDDFPINDLPTEY